MQTKQNGGIQAMRALACFLVLIQHVTYFTCVAKDLDYRVYLPINFGRIGVGLFFVISGFVMGQCLNQGNRFLWNRAIRIFPPFWIAMVLSAALFFLIGRPWEFDWWSFFLLPTTLANNSYQIPYWTLCYEMAFYVVTYLFILSKLSKSHIAFACVVWIAAIILVDGYGGSGFLAPMTDSIVAQPGWWILLSPVSSMFAMGLLVSVSDRNFLDAIPATYLAVLALCVGYLGLSLVDKIDTRGPPDLLLSISFVLVVVAATKLEAPKMLQQLGDFSYGTYLIHMVAIAAFFTLLQPHFATMRFSELWLIFGTASATAGLLFGIAEYQLHTRYLRKLFRPRDRREFGNEVTDAGLIPTAALNEG